MAMALGMGSAAAGAPADLHATPQLAHPQTALIRGSVTGNAHHSAAPAPHSARNNAATSITVGNCDDSGSGSLREAVTSASSGATVDLSGLPNCTINLQSSIVTSVDDLTLQDTTDATQVTVSGQYQHTILVHNGSGTLTLSGMSFVEGRTATSTPVARGGCIASGGTLVIDNTTLKYCQAVNDGTGSAEGGAVSGFYGVTISNSLVLSNHATNTGSGDAGGGAIWSNGDVDVNDRTVVAYNEAQANGGGSVEGGGICSNGRTYLHGNAQLLENSAISVGGGAFGGGIHAGAGADVKYSQVSGNTAYSFDVSARGGAIELGSGMLSIGFSSISDNQASSPQGSSLGGAVWTQGNVYMHHSTVAGNSAQLVGGIDLLGSHANQPLRIEESTISGNVSSESNFGAGIYMGNAGEIFNSTITANIESNADDNIYGAGLSVAGNTQVDLVSNIISGNSLKLGNGSLTPSDINAANGGSNVSLSGDVNLIGFVGPSYPPNSIVSDNPGLEPLADNGGPTMTHALKPSSLAVDAGDAGGDTTDQRGGGFDRVVGARADVGAFELGNDRIFVNGFESP